MIITPDTPGYVGKRWHVYDANGFEYHYVTWLDTESGEIERLVTDVHGCTIAYNGELAREIIKAAPPLLVVEWEDSKCRSEQ